MAQLGLAIAGGAAFGPWGWLAGSLLGSWLFAKDTKGPRLNDLSVTISSQGIPIGLGYGTIPMGGNVVWKTDLVEHKRKTSAKGGPTITEYYYTCSLAVCFANREAKHFLKLYVDNKLIFDASASGVYAPTGEDAIINEYNIKYRFYLGSETQEPDPLIESIEGVGNVPAFRGCCYVVFEDLNVTNFGNRIPSFQAVIAFGSAPTYPWVKSSAMSADGTSHIFDHARGKLFSSWSSHVHVFDNNTNENTSKKDVGPTYSTGPLSLDPEGRFYVQGMTGNYGPMFQMDPDNLQSIRSMGRTSSSGGWDKIHIQASGVPLTISGENCMVFASNQGADITIYSRDKDHYLYPGRRRPYGYASRFDHSYSWVADSDYVHPVFPNLSPAIHQICVDKDGVVWGAGGIYLHPPGYLFKIQITLVPNPDWEAFPGTDKIGSFTIERIDMSDAVTAMGGCIEYIVYVPDDHSLILFSVYNKRVAKWDIESREFIAFNDSLIFVVQSQNMELQNGYIGIVTTGFTYTLINAITLEAEKVYTLYPNFVLDSGFYGHVAGWDQRTNSLYYINHENEGSPPVNKRYTYRLFLDRISNGTESLDTVVQDICIRSGMLAADIDVTDLATLNVRGINYTSDSSAIQLVQSLMQAYLFIGVESDWKIKFTRLGTAEVFTITNNEIGVSGEKRDDSTKLKLSMGNEEEIPYHVGVTYIDETNDYEQNEQHSNRSLDGTISRSRLIINLDIVLSNDEAKQLSEKWLLLGWNRRKSLETTTFPRHLRIDPGDVGSISDESNEYSAYILNSSYGANGLLQIEALIDDIDIFSSISSGYGGEITPQELIDAGYTELFYFDIPALRDADYNSGTGIVLYFGCGSRNASWNGALVMRSQDQYNYSKIASSLNSTTWGKATTILGSSSGWASWDPFKTLTIDLISGSLESKTKLEVLQGSNFAALQSGENWEIIQFATVTDNGDGTYTLKGMTRGRRGTNNYQSGHAVGDLFVLLSETTIERYLAPNDDYLQLRYYKANTIGTIIDSYPQSRTNLAKSYYPYSPTYVKGSRDGSNNLTITWKRRTRVGGLWTDSTGAVPLGEESESYEIDILDSAGIILRTLELTAETASYTAAQQTLDGLIPGDLISMIIYQTNNLVGRGFGTEVTI